MQEPLHDQHESLRAQWRDWLGANVPSSYGDVGAEYRTLRQAAGVIDMSPLGKLRVTGNDRITYLQGQLSQDVAPLANAGAGTYSCLLKPTGQMLSDMVLFAPDEQSVVILTPPHTLQTVYNRLEQFIIMEEVEIADISAHWVLVHVAGPRAVSVLQPLGLQQGLPIWHCRIATWQDQAVTLVRTDRTGEEGYDLLAPVGSAGNLWQWLLDAGALPVGYEAWNIRRVEAGIPLFGIDMDDSTIPLEAGLGDSAISFTKGCYTGQEVVHRIYSRGHTNRSLVGLRLSENLLPPSRAPISTADRRDAGWVTSAVRSLSLATGIALGYLRNEYTVPGTEVSIRIDNSSLGATVVSLPFVEPSRA